MPAAHMRPKLNSTLVAHFPVVRSCRTNSRYGLSRNIGSAFENLVVPEDALPGTLALTNQPVGGSPPVDFWKGDWGSFVNNHCAIAGKPKRFSENGQGKPGMCVGMEASGHARWFERLMGELHF